MASIENRGNGQYRVKWKAGRGGEPRSATFPDDKLAERAKQLVDAHNQRITRDEVYRVILGLPEFDTLAEEAANRTVPTVEQFIETFAERKKGVEAETVKGYKRLLTVKIKPLMGARRLNDVTEEMIEDWVDDLDRRYKASTVRRYHAIAHQFFEMAVAKKHIVVNPCAASETRSLPKVDRFDAVFLSELEAAILVAACPPVIRDMVAVALGTGMRWGELAALQRQDIKIQNGRVVVLVRRARKADGKAGRPKSKMSVRSISVSGKIAAILRRIVERLARPASLVFPAPMGGMWSPDNFRIRFWLPTIAKAQRCDAHPPAKKADKRGRIKDDPLGISTCACENRMHAAPRFHDLRHTHVGLLLEAKWDLYAIQKRIGHESIKTTFDIYGHLRPMGDDVELQALDDRLPDFDLGAVKASGLGLAA